MRPSGWRCCCCSVCGCHSMQFTVVTSLPMFDPQGAGADPWGQVADVVVVVFCVWLSLHAVYCCNISACVWSSGCWSWSMRPSGWRCCFVCGCHSMQFTVVTSLPLFDPQGAGADPWGQVADVVVVFCVCLSLHAVYCCNISACVWSSGCWSWSMRPSGWRVWVFRSQIRHCRSCNRKQDSKATWTIWNSASRSSERWAI